MNDENNLEQREDKYEGFIDISEEKDAIKGKKKLDPNRETKKYKPQSEVKPEDAIDNTHESFVEVNNKKFVFFPRNFVEANLSYLDCWIIFALGFLVPNAVSLILGFSVGWMFVNENETGYSNGFMVALQISAQIAAIAAILLFLGLARRNAFKAIFTSMKNKWLIIYIVIFIAFMYLINFLTNLSLNAIQKALLGEVNSNENQVMVESMLRSYAFPMAISTVILAPIHEELTYRLALCGGVYRKKVYLGIILSGVIFGFVHFDSSVVLNYFMKPTEYKISLIIELTNLPSYIITGLVFALAYKVSGSLLTPIVCHFVNNLFATITVFVLSNSSSSSPENIQTLAYLFTNNFDLVTSLQTIVYNFNVNFNLNLLEVTHLDYAKCIRI